MKTFIVGDIHGRRTQLRDLIGMLPRDEQADTLVFLGDLIDRGDDAPGVVSDVMSIQERNPDRVVCIRGNHEQMLLDFLAQAAPLWLTPVTGGERTFEQYTGSAPAVTKEDDFELMREKILNAIPAAHLDFIRLMPLYYEDEYALYVHAGLDNGKHPSDTDPRMLLWSRDMEFFKHYRGKPCVFGHTPTAFLPLRGRLGRHGIYIFHSAIGLDTGYNHQSPLSCLQFPDFILYQTFADGHAVTHHITNFIPETLRAMQQKAESNDNDTARS